MDPFVAEIRIFPFNFAPTHWAFCDGQTIPLQQNTALYALLGTVYGGDGKSTFALPNMQGSAPMHWGQGPGLSDHSIGEAYGTETVTLLQSEIPAHVHAVQASIEYSESKSPDNKAFATSSNGNIFSPGNGLQQVTMSPSTLSTEGGSLPHNNMMPYLTLNFCIALEGVFPQRW